MRSKKIDIFKALGDITRQDILELLREHERCVSEICDEFASMTQPTISHHLNILRLCDLVETRRKGKMIYYSINRKALRSGVEELIERFDIEVI